MAGRQRLICESAALAEGGPGVRFDWPAAGGPGKGFAVRPVGPEQAGEPLPAVCTIGLDGEVDQECAALVGLEGGEGPAIDSEG